MGRTIPLSGETEALLQPGRPKSIAYKTQPKPCVVILIHGVNDLAGCYDDLETGICQGLNERLDHLTNAQGRPNASALNPANYTIPPAKDAELSNPDAIYYRREGSQGKNAGPARSVVIPFYWGFREEEAKIKKNTPHGEWTDRFDNRLDKAGTKEGGMFANATTTLPDMWGEGFSGRMAVLPANPLFGSPDHPLLKAPGRKYMLLAAQRLVMLVKMIRSYRSEDGKRSGTDDTINVVAHSQGTMITLLANALLSEQGERPIDGFVMMNSPYSLHETFAEYAQLWGAQQTTEARLRTLAGIVQFIGAYPNPSPSLSELASHLHPGGIGGPRWTGGPSCSTTLDGKEVPFNERDNRGCSYLYFTPQDQTVGLKNVQGIGWEGVGDIVTYYQQDAPNPFSDRSLTHEKRLPALSTLGANFSQRIFTLRKRDHQAEKVGKSPSYAYMLKESSFMGFGETTWEGTEMGAGVAANAHLEGGRAVTIAAPALPVPFAPDFSTHGTRIASGESAGIAPVRAAADPIDAAIAVTNGGMKKISTRNLSGVYRSWGSDEENQRWAEEQAADINDLSRNPWTDRGNNEWAADWHRARVVVGSDGTVRVDYLESPNEAKRRMIDTPLEGQKAISFHSAIPMNPMHSRRAVAYDLAIGQAKSIDDEVFYSYLCRVADWRLDWLGADDSFVGEKKVAANLALGEVPGPDVLAFYDAEKQRHPGNRDLIDATVNYRQTGRPPSQMNIEKIPQLVVSQTVNDRRRGVSLREGGSPPQRDRV